MNSVERYVQEWRNVDAEVFRREIVTQYRPAILRGLVKDWPVVRQAKTSPEAFCHYLSALDNGADVDAILLAPEERGRIFYDSNMDGFNYLHSRRSVSQVLEQMQRYAAFPSPPAVAAQSARIAECLPSLLRDHPMPLLDPSIEPRIWLGNAIITPAHFDESNNLACVIGGRRKFTLLPPEQIRNLYIGPLDFAPTGTPISLVSFDNPDFGRFPRFREALAAAQVAELEPGDALYIPALWFHHVRSLSKFNGLVNYWWRNSVDATHRPVSAQDCLLLSLLALKSLEPQHRAAWREIFDYYVFDIDSHPEAHIPEHRHGVLGKLTPALTAQVKKFLIGKLGQ
jgi:hypothetical protein